MPARRTATDTPASVRRASARALSPELLLPALERGHDLGELLGLGAALVSPFSEEVPMTITAAELAELFPSEATASSLERAVKLGLVEPDGDGFRVPSPRLLRCSAAQPAGLSRSCCR